MLNMLHKFVVPEVDDVDIYQDDQDPLQFWMVPQRLRLSTDADGEPALNILAFARDLSLIAGVDEPLPPGQTEGGLMGMTVECTVSQDDQRKILDYARAQVLSGALSMPRPVAVGGQVEVQWRAPTGGEPKLGYPTWLEGDAQFSLPSALGPTFLLSTENKVKPSLTGSNVSSFTIAFGQEGIRLVRDGVETGKLTAGVAYSLQFMARIPSISVTVSGDADDVYREIKEHTTIVESRNNVPLRTFPQVSSLSQLKTITSSLHVEYTKFDFGGQPAPDALREKLEAMVLEITLSYLKSVFCQPLVTGQLDKEKLGTDPMQNFNPPGTPVAGGNQLWLRDFKQEGDFHFGMTFHGNLARPFAAYPKADIVDMLTHEQLKKSFATADLNDPILATLQVPVRVTADFANDPIFTITVSVDYRQTDDLNGEVKAKSETFTFDDSAKPKYFRTVMAMDAQGVPKDTFTYSSVVNFKHSQGRTEIPSRQTRERSLIIGYDRLDCVDVKAVAGAVPWNTVDAIQIDFSLPGVDLPTAKQTVVLNEKQPEGSYFTYTGGSDQREFEYTCEFFMKSGKRMTIPAVRTNSGRLVIDAPFEDKLVATFVPQGQFPPLRTIVLATRYVDEQTDFRADGTHVFTSDSDVWRWEVDLPESDRRAFEYKADITYADGTTTAGRWQQGEEGTVLVGEVKSSMLEVAVSGVVLDMTKWKLVVVRLRYEDPTTKEVQEHIVQLTPANAAAGVTWKVALKDSAATSYTYQIDGYGVDGSRKTVPVTSSSDKLLVVEL